MHPRKILKASAFRLALGYAALFGSSALLLLGFLYWSTAGYMLRQADETTDAEIRVLEERYRNTGLAGLSALIQERVGREPPGPSIYLLTDAQNRPLVGNLRGWPSESRDEQGWLNFDLGIPGHWARARPFHLRGDFYLLVGRDMHELDRIRSRIITAMGWGLAWTLALALAGGVLVSRGRLRRIGAINASIGEVMAGDLSQRIPKEATGDDIEQLVEHVNGMLDELERLVDGIRRVSDNIAHDLRTPLARLRNRLEHLRRDEQKDPGDDRREAVDQAIAEADALLSTFGALLRIARLESGERRSAFAELDLSTIVDDVAELYQPLIEEREQSLWLRREEGVTVHGDRDLLFQALANLVDNAVKYTPRGGHIEIALAATEATAKLAVADDGPGVPPEARERVLQRFYRIDSARSTPGAGLGLSLVAAVAELHQATLRLENNAPGLRVKLELPRIGSGPRSSTSGIPAVE